MASKYRQAARLSNLEKDDAADLEQIPIIEALADMALADRSVYTHETKVTRSA